MEIKLFFWILIIHFVGDFLLQSDWQAKNKSTSGTALCAHTSVYSVTIAILALPYITEFWQFMALMTITWICHTITDAITSRIVKHYFSKEDHHNGFVIIGADQILHYVQLVLTFNFILQ